MFNGLDNFDEPSQIAAPSNGLQKALQKVSGILGLGAPNEKDYIKRIIALPGDRVMCCDAQGRVTVQAPGGTPKSLDEPYIFENNPVGDPAAISVPSAGPANRPAHPAPPACSCPRDGCG